AREPRGAAKRLPAVHRSLARSQDFYCLQYTRAETHPTLSRLDEARRKSQTALQRARLPQHRRNRIRNVLDVRRIDPRNVDPTRLDHINMKALAQLDNPLAIDPKKREHSPLVRNEREIDRRAPLRELVDEQ